MKLGKKNYATSFITYSISKACSLNHIEIVTVKTFFFLNLVKTKF